MARVPSHMRHALPIKGIRKLHSIRYESGGLIGTTVSCLVCLQSGERCKDCSEKPFTVKPEKVISALAEGSDPADNSESEEIEDNDDSHRVDEEEESSDFETDTDQSESDDEEEEDVTEGVTVWAPFADKMYPALVVSLSGVPPYLQRQLKSKNSDMQCVRWIGELDDLGNPVERYSSVSKSSLKILKEDSIDHILSKNCPLQYMEALNQAQCP